MEVGWATDEFPWSLCLVGGIEKSLVWLSVGSEPDVELSEVVAEAGGPLSLSIYSLAIYEVVAVAVFNSVEHIADCLPVFQVLASHHGCAGHEVHGCGYHIVIVSSPADGVVWHVGIDNRIAIALSRRFASE